MTEEELRTYLSQYVNFLRMSFDWGMSAPRKLIFTLVGKMEWLKTDKDAIFDWMVDNSSAGSTIKLIWEVDEEHKPLIKFIDQELAKI